MNIAFMLHAGAHHWICSSRTPGGSVCVMDSKAFQSSPITKTTELQLAKIYSPSPSKSSLRVEIASVQQQQGLHDCGLFAIAYATEICLGRKPDEAQFDKNLMRQHLIKCLNEKNSL